MVPRLRRRIERPGARKAGTEASASRLSPNGGRGHRTAAETSRHAPTALVLLAGLLAAAPAAADIVDKKQSVDSPDRAPCRPGSRPRKQRESALQLGDRRRLRRRSGASSSEVGDVSDRLVPLEHELELRELKLNRLNALYQVQAERLGFLREQYRTAIARLNQRLVAAYESSTPDDMAVLLSSRSFSAFIDGLTYIRLVADHDRQIVESVRRDA